MFTEVRKKGCRRVIGPEGGHGGGRLVVTGTPEHVAACTASHTGRLLKAHLNSSAAV